MRKNVDRFNGVTEEELYTKSLDDRIDFNLDIVFVNINPGLYSVYKGHHYSGPGNHFWRCLYDSGLTNKVLKSSEDFKILDFKMGLMNMIQKPNIKSCQELTSDEIKEAQDSLNKRIKYYKPKIVAFNGKTIFEIYTGSSVDKEFNFGKQPIRFANNTTDTYMYVMPSSSARCSQLPKVADKVPFYAALKKFREYLTGYINELSDLEIMFPDFKVALEVNNEETPSAVNNSINQKNKSKPDYMSDSEDNNSMLEDSIVQNNTTVNDPSTPVLNNHKIKFVRLNNIPFSDIPSDILENLKIQRKLKKNVTIITTTKGLFQKNIKKSNLFNNKSNVHSHSHINPSSDFDTATSDSSDYCNSMSNDPTDKQAHPQQQQQQASSKLTSLILNVCNSASTNNSNSSFTSSTNTSNQQAAYPTTPVINRSHVEHQIKPLVVQQQASPLTSSQQTPNVINKSLNNSTIKQILAAPLNNQINTQQYKPIAIDSSNKTKVINQASSQSISAKTNSNSQIAIQPQKVIQMNNDNKKIIIINTNTNVVTSSNISPVYEANENDFLIEYEVVKPNQNNYCDYYTFESVNQNASQYHPNSHFYSEELRYDLNRVIKLYYGDESVDENSSHIGIKRSFSSINEANMYIQNSRESKRHCNLNFNKL